MPIYISYHPIDGLFAAELLAHLKNDGFAPKLVPSTCNDNICFSENDLVIAIFRPDYIKSSAYQSFSQLGFELNILPILRAPIALDDWNGTQVLSSIADFTSQNIEQRSSNLGTLSQSLALYREVFPATKPTTEEVHLNLLEEALQRPCSTLNLLETFNHNCDSPARNPVYTLLDEALFKIVPRNPDDILADTHRPEQLKTIVKEHAAYTLICEDWDPQLVTAFLVDIAIQQRLSSSGKLIIPILLDIGKWDNELSWSNWLVGQNIINESTLDNAETRELVLYVHGFEHSSLKLHQFRERFSVWWRDNCPPPSLILVCTQPDESSRTNGNEITVELVKYDLRYLRGLCSRYSNRPFAQFLLNCTEDNKAFPQLTYLVHNPVFTASVLSLQFESNEDFYKLGVRDYFERYINNLWEIGGGDNKAVFPQIKDALLKIAAITTERRKLSISYTEALNFVQSEVLLNKCIEVGLFILIGTEIHFSMQMLMDYFAATALVKYGIPDHLPRLTLNEQSDRISQHWDKAVVIASHLASTPDTLVRQVADIDPLLALQCIASGINFTSSLYSYAIDKNLEALVNIGDFRVYFSKLLYTINPDTAKAILVEVLRKARWSNRLYAYATFTEMVTPSLPGLIESLADINDHTRTKVSQAIRRIGPNALPTLFQLLHHDNVTIRLNAVWAISELKDKAYVPALVKMLRDNNTTVIKQAAITLGVLLDIDSVPYLVKHLQQRHSSIRRAIVNSLLKIQNKQPDAFINTIQRMDPANRRLVVVYLSASQSTVMSDFLLAFSYDENVDVRITALEGLATIAEPRVISRLEECLEDMSKSKLSKSSVSEIVSRILSTLPRHEFGTVKHLNSSQVVKARLLNAKEQQSNFEALDSDDSLTIAAEQDIVDDVSQTESSEDSYVADILAQLRARKWDTSNNAAKLLQSYIKDLHGNTSLKVINQILETLNDRDWVIRWTGVETLGWVGNVHVVPHLIQRLEDANWKVRVAAIRALVEIKDDSAIAGLSTRISDLNSVVREAAAEALGYLEGKQAISALEKAASDPEDFVRLAAVESLGKTHDKVATPSLLLALKDSSEHVRWAAANSLFDIADASLVPLLIPSLSDTAGPYWEQKRICDVIVDILKQVGTEEAKQALLEWQNG